MLHPSGEGLHSSCSLESHQCLDLDSLLVGVQLLLKVEYVQSCDIVAFNKI